MAAGNTCPRATGGVPEVLGKAPASVGASPRGRDAAVPPCPRAACGTSAQAAVSEPSPAGYDSPGAGPRNGAGDPKPSAGRASISVGALSRCGTTPEASLGAGSLHPSRTDAPVDPCGARRSRRGRPLEGLSARLARHRRARRSAEPARQGWRRGRPARTRRHGPQRTRDRRAQRPDRVTREDGAGLNVTPLGETGGSAKRAGSQSQQYGRNPRRAPASVGASSRLLEPEAGLSARR